MLTIRHYQWALRNIAGLLLSRTRLLSQKFSTSSVLLASYYETLGLPPNATQTDIKAAYYKLSMLYHPDKSKNDTSAEKFRNISEAYEVLGNFKLRRLYDKGIIHTASSRYSDVRPRYPDDLANKEDEPDDAQTRFYKAHMKKSQVPNSAGRTPIYNFDEWSRAHYGSTFERRKDAKFRFEERAERRRTYGDEIEKETLLIGFMIFVAFYAVIFSRSSDVDFVTEKRKTAVSDSVMKKSESDS